MILILYHLSADLTLYSTLLVKTFDPGFLIHLQLGHYIQSVPTRKKFFQVSTKNKNEISHWIFELV